MVIFLDMRDFLDVVIIDVLIKVILCMEVYKLGLYMIGV